VSSSRLVGTSFVEQLGLHFHKRGMDTSGKCNIAAPGSGIYVAIYELSQSDKAELDEIEGVGFGYTDSIVDIPDFGQCRTYISERSHVDDYLPAFDWYRELVLQGCRFHGFPDSYTRRIERVRVVPDPDASRSDDKWRLVDRLKAAS